MTSQIGVRIFIISLFILWRHLGKKISSLRPAAGKDKILDARGLHQREILKLFTIFFLKKNYQLFLLVQGKRMMIKICSVNIKGHLNLLIGKKKNKCLTEKWNNRTKTLHISLSWRSLTNRLVKHIAHLSRTAEIFLIFWTNTCYLLISETSTPICWQEMNSALSFSPVQRGHLLLTYSSQKSLFPFALSSHVYQSLEIRSFTFKIDMII